jgi:Protein of unknown function (DUF2889)
MKMELFHRDKQFRVDWEPDSDVFTVGVDMQDAFHDMGVVVTFSYPELVITSVQPRMTKTPYPVCPTALARAQDGVGLQVKPAISLLLARQIGGREGCAHVTNLVLDACHSAVQGLLAIRRMREDDGGRPIPVQEKISYLEGHGLSVKDSCVAYTLPSDGAA